MTERIAWGETEVNSAVERIDADLREAGTPKRAEWDKSYLKSPLELMHYGVSVPELHKQVKAFIKAYPGLHVEDFIALVEALWQRPLHDSRAFAILLLGQRKVELRPEHIGLVEWMVRDSHTWAYVDGLAASIAGSLVEQYPELNMVLDRWALDDNFWIRRSTLLALLHPLRRGEGDFDRFCRYADGMLDEKEFFIRKAIGWVLRDTSKRRPEPVRAYLESRLNTVSGLTLREGARHLTPEDRDVLIAAYKSRTKAIAHKM